MSHAANLRKYRPQQSNLSAKRRRLSISDDSLQKPNGTFKPSFPDGNLAAVSTKDLKQKGNAHVDSTKATVRQAQDSKDVVELSDDEDDVESSNSDASEEESDEDEDENDRRHRDKSSDRSSDEDEEAADEDELQASEKSNHHDQPATAGMDENDTAGGPTFGDMLQSRSLDTVTVDVPEEDRQAESTGLNGTTANKALTVPSANSLGTVLAQALKTNDVDLLESCLHVPDLESIRATIERIHPRQATALLQRLAERLHKRPGRAGSLMVWVQWTVVAHGGYLASQPEAMRELRTLYQVVKQRASGLQPLLALKGKLDMLEAQMQLRRNMQARSKAARRGEEEEGVIYVEGQESSDSDDEMELEHRSSSVLGKSAKARKPTASKPTLGASSDEESDADGLPTALPNGIEGSEGDAEELGEEDEDESDEDEDGFIDDEAEESDEERDDELSDEIDFDDVDGADDGISESEDEDDNEEPPTKRSKVTKSSSLRHGR